MRREFEGRQWKYSQAHKTHTCEFCRGPIPAGENYFWTYANRLPKMCRWCGEDRGWEYPPTDYPEEFWFSKERDQKTRGELRMQQEYWLDRGVLVRVEELSPDHRYYVAHRYFRKGEPLAQRFLEMDRDLWSDVPPSSRKHAPIVYYAQGDGDLIRSELIKIGTTTCLKKRLARLHAELLTAELGNKDFEKKRHREFDAWNARIGSVNRYGDGQEWFYDNESLRSHISWLPLDPGWLNGAKAIEWAMSERRVA